MAWKKKKYVNADDGVVAVPGPMGPQGPQGDKGDSGDIGPIGPQGLQGEQGPIGLQGIQGIKGNQGDVGPAGPQGIQGIKGDKGDTGVQGIQGIQGPKGDTGAQGPQGLKGDTGATGAQGLQGIEGPAGLKGDTGAQGPQGLKGDTGLQGPQGIQGEAGLQGPKGDIGDQGSAGVDGKSAYEVAIINGFSGTEQEWLDSLVGPQGPAGTGGSGSGGSTLVTRYVHSGNQELHIASVDWTTGIVTFTEPHGLIGNLQVIICPTYKGLDNPQRDFLSIPMEWVKPQGVAVGTQNTGLGLSVVDSISAKVVRSSDFTTALPVTLTSTENNGRVDMTKFHFEIPIAWSITNLPHLKQFLIRSFGYVKYMTQTGSQYRYTNMMCDWEDGTTGYTPYINFLGLPSIANSAATAGTYLVQDWFVDITNQQMMVDNTYTYHFGRRAGYNSLVWDGQLETVGRRFFNLPKQPLGAVAISTYSAPYSYMANETVIEIWNKGS